MSTAVLTAWGCGSSGRISRANDELRRSNLELEKQIESFRKQMTRQEQEIAALQQQVQQPEQVPGAKVPRLNAIAFGRYSGALDENDDGKDDIIRLFVRTLDQAGHFLPVGGRAQVQVVAVLESPGPLEVAKASYEPAAWAKAYRSGLAGTHYRLELPLPEKLPDGVTQLTAQVTLVDAATGVKHVKQMAVPVR